MQKLPPVPEASSETIRASMKSNRRVDTKPEALIRSILHRRGCRFRKDMLLKYEGGQVRPDIVFTRQRVAVFIDGCFWHMCPEHGHIPKSNVKYWKAKLVGSQTNFVGRGTEQNADSRLFRALFARLG